MDEANDLRLSRRVASRKFMLAVCVLVLAAWLLLSGRIEAAVWSELTIYTLGLYFAGNVGTWFAEALKGRG